MVEVVYDLHGHRPDDVGLMTMSGIVDQCLTDGQSNVIIKSSANIFQQIFPVCLSACLSVLGHTIQGRSDHICRAVDIITSCLAKVDKTDMNMDSIK